MKKFKFLEHTADIKFQAFGKSLEKVFINSAYALTKSITKSKVRSKIRKNISVKGKNFESLMYNFLEELLFLFDSEYFVLRKIKKIKIEKFKLSAEIYGDKAENKKIDNHIKAVTYSEMFVKKEKNWIAQVVLDI